MKLMWSYVVVVLKVSSFPLSPPPKKKHQNIQQSTTTVNLEMVHIGHDTKYKTQNIVAAVCLDANIFLFWLQAH